MEAIPLFVKKAMFTFEDHWFYQTVLINKKSNEYNGSNPI